MTYSTKTRSNTSAGCYHVRTTVSHRKNRQKTNGRQKPKGRSQTMPCPELLPTTILPLMPLVASIICLFLHSVVDCAVGFNCHDFQSTSSPKVRHSPAGASFDSCTQPLGSNHGLCCRLQLSWLPVNRSSEGDTQSCSIVIGITLNNSIEGTAPISWSVVDSRTQPLGSNHGFYWRCWCQN